MFGIVRGKRRKKKGETLKSEDSKSEDSKGGDSKGETRLPPSVEMRSPAGVRGGGVVREIGGPRGAEPTRYGDWERKGRCIDF